MQPERVARLFPNVYLSAKCQFLLSDEYSYVDLKYFDICVK